MERNPSNSTEQEPISPLELSVREKAESLLDTLVRQRVYDKQNDPSTAGNISKSEGSDIDSQTKAIVEMYMDNIFNNPQTAQLLEYNEEAAKTDSQLSGALAGFLVEKQLNMLDEDQDEMSEAKAA